MPDITMCKGEDCKIKESCYRFTAIPCKYQQSYFVDVPYINNNKCQYILTKISEK